MHSQRRSLDALCLGLMALRQEATSEWLFIYIFSSPLLHTFMPQPIPAISGKKSQLIFFKANSQKHIFFSCFQMKLPNSRKLDDIQWNKSGIWTRKIWVWVPALSIISCVTQGKALSPSESPFLNLWNTHTHRHTYNFVYRKWKAAHKIKNRIFKS